MHKSKGHQNVGILAASALKLEHVFESLEKFCEIVFVEYQMKIIFYQVSTFFKPATGIFFFFFFLKLGKKSPRFDWESSCISAPKTTKNIPATEMPVSTEKNIYSQTTSTVSKNICNGLY